MSAQPVWPPTVGTTSALNTAPLAWIGLKVESACQPSLPLRIWTTSSPPSGARRVPSSRTLLTAPISNSSGPKRFAKAICSSFLRNWPGKISRAYSSQVACRAFQVASSISGRRRPVITAPNEASTGWTSKGLAMGSSMGSSIREPRFGPCLAAVYRAGRGTDNQGGLQNAPPHDAQRNGTHRGCCHRRRRRGSAAVGRLRPGQDADHQPPARLAGQQQQYRRGGGQRARLLRGGEAQRQDPAGRAEHRRRGDRRLGPLRNRPGLVEPVADAGGVAEDPGDLLRDRPAAAPLHVLLAGEEADPRAQGHDWQE